MTDETTTPQVHRFKPGTVALKDVRPALLTNSNVGDKLGLQRLLRAIVQSTASELKMQSSAIACVDEALQAYMIGLCENVNLIAVHSRRVTCTAQDVFAAISDAKRVAAVDKSALLQVTKAYDKHAVARFGRRGGIKRFSEVKRSCEIFGRN
jgi:histone H3/H4